MSLYWEKENVAVEVVDDPGSAPFDRGAHPDATVLEITCEELLDPEAFGRFARTLAGCLGRDGAGEDELREELFGGSAW